jgi:hypothetical protein
LPADGFRSETIFSRFLFPFELLVLDEYDESLSEPLSDEPDELSPALFLEPRTAFSRDGGEIGRLRLAIAIGETAFFDGKRCLTGE